jgi:hypothetical protein
MADFPSDNVSKLEASERKHRIEKMIEQVSS